MYKTSKIGLVKVVILLLATFATIKLQAQQMSVMASLDTNKILIGEQTSLKLSATTTPDYKLQWPVLKDSIYKIEIVSAGKIDTSYSEDKKFITYAQAFTITCFDSGFKAIPPFQFGYQIGKDTTKQFMASDAMLLQVAGVIVDTTKAIKEIKPPLEIPFSILDFVKEYWPYIIGILAILGILLWWFIFRKKSVVEAPKEKPTPTRPADVIALEQLNILEKKKLWQDGSYKLYHSELADIVRTYIENRYSIMAMELTTDETIRGLNTLNPVDKEKLIQLLTLADLVKFAKAQPIHYENELSLKNAYDFVRQTALQAKNDTQQ